MKIQYKYSYLLYFFIFVIFNHIQIEKINIYSYNIREDIQKILNGGTYMKYIQFTKKENEIMDILWKHDVAMSANDIKLASKNLSINTIQQTLQKLLEIKYIKVAGIGQNKKAITRLYRPVISEAQYVNSFIGEDTRAKISAYFVEHTDDLEMIEQLKKLIQEKEKELK